MYLLESPLAHHPFLIHPSSPSARAPLSTLVFLAILLLIILAPLPLLYSPLRWKIEKDFLSAKILLSFWRLISHLRSLGRQIDHLLWFDSITVSVLGDILLSSTNTESEADTSKI